MVLSARSPVGQLASLAMGLLALVSSGSPIGAASPDGGLSSLPATVKLKVEPSEVILRGASRQQQLQITAVLAGGDVRDVTHVAQLSVSSPQLARLDRATVFGVSDGDGYLDVQLGGSQLRVPLIVRDFASYPAVHFANDVVPVFSKLGCNGGGCHGKASGQNGFKLSVFGFDPEADYTALVKEARGRRIFPASPTDSLLIAKPSGRIPHGGGQRLEPDSNDYVLLVEWIKQGMPAGQSDAPHAIEIRLSPRERVLCFGGQQQILATAIYTDGSRRDVTAAAGYASNAALVAEVDARGLVRVGQVPGQAAITVNYLGHVAAVEIQVPRPGAPQPYPKQPVNNQIDQLVWTRLEKMGIVPSELVDDATFLRRAYLDAIGTLPTPDEVRRFLTDDRADRRDRWIDTLLDRREYADYWALKWSDILLVDRNRLADRGAYELHQWLREQFATNRHYDEWVRELITAGGNSAISGPVNFYRAVDTADAAARTLSQAFLGVRVECAQCHHHPFEKWSQDDFYGLAGFFNGLERRQITPDRTLVFHAGYRETRVPLSNRLVATRPLDGSAPVDLSQGDPRVKLAAWMTDPANPWFARLACNRLWKQFFARGLVEPEDDLRSTNPATNEPLLQFLAGQLVQKHYDLKALMRLVLKSRVYQLSSTPNATNADDEQNFSHHYVRRLPAEVMLDAISAATLVDEKFPGRPPGTRAIELWDNRLPSYFLEIFGRPERNSPCECGRSSEPTMAQALHLMNAPEVEAKVASSRGRVAQLVKKAATRSEIIDELCLAALGRAAGDKERQVAERLFATAPPQAAAEDLLWTLLNCYDFLFIQ
ncbi:MAG: DUF1553 domain-containing protein [Planctomycetia bacterium]|nr:DUF1553 domain-containing protein [Planctomycetia bacterium]